MLLHVLVARARLASATFSWSEDKGAFPLKKFFRTAFLPFGPGTSSTAVPRLVALTRNNVENEPFFLAVAWAFGKVVGTSSFGTKLLLVYIMTRILHNMLLSMIQAQPYRALTYITGVLISLYMSVSVLQATQGALWDIPKLLSSEL
ncbi:unnamed protein product [Chrysoparadoxa australica]